MSSRQVRYWLKNTRKDAHLRLVNIAVRRNEYHQITAWNTRWEVDNDAQMLVTMWRDKHPTIHELADVFGKEAIGDVVCDYSTTAIYNLKICDEQDQLPLMDKPHDYPVRRAEMKPWEEEMTDKKITNPGIYAVSVKWVSSQNVGAKQTPAIKLLLVSEEHGKIYATIWNSEKARSGEYMKRICEAFAIPNIPPESADDFADKQCNIVVNINERGYPEVDAFQPYDPHREATAGEPEPEPERQTTQEYLDSSKPPKTETDEEVPF